MTTTAIKRLFPALAVMCFALAISGAAAKAQQTVEDVAIDLRASAPEPPEAMKQKIIFSVRQVGLKALQGKTLEEAEDIKPDLTPLMERIFNQVLAGYTVKAVDITVGRATSIRLDIEPEGPFIEDLAVLPGFEGDVHQVWEEMLAPELKSVRDSLAGIFRAVPVSSAPWAAKTLAGTISESAPLDKLFPGFHAEPVLEMEGGKATLNLNLKASGGAIRVANLKVRSNTIPSMALEKLKFEAAARTSLLVGLPVEFAAERKEAIASAMAAFLAESSIAKSLYLDMTVKIQTGFTTRVAVIAESEKYSGFLRGYVKLGEDSRNPDIEAHIGAFPIKRIEAFTELNFFPGPIALQANVGVGFKLNPKFYGAVGRNFIDGINRIWLNTYVTEDIILSWEKGVVEDNRKDIEGSITFKAHEFFSFTATTDFNTDIWLAIIANL